MSELQILKFVGRYNFEYGECFQVNPRYKTLDFASFYGPK